MKTVDEMIEDILAQEGGFVNDPADTGGATKHGISLRYARGIGLDLDGDGDTDEDDIVLVTKDTAAKLYKCDFFYAPRINQLPSELWPQLFDISVNMGGHRAIELAQKAANHFGADLTEDGRMGPKTRAGIKHGMRRAGFEKLNNLIVFYRQEFYTTLVYKRSSQERFLKGWLRRAESFRVPEPHDA